MSRWVFGFLVPRRVSMLFWIFWKVGEFGLRCCFGFVVLNRCFGGVCSFSLGGIVLLIVWDA